jgi:hypothetical protein
MNDVLLHEHTPYTPIVHAPSQGQKCNEPCRFKKKILPANEVRQHALICLEARGDEGGDFFVLNVLHEVLNEFPIGSKVPPDVGQISIFTLT